MTGRGPSPFYLQSLLMKDTLLVSMSTTSRIPEGITVMICRLWSSTLGAVQLLCTFGASTGQSNYYETL